MKKVLMLVCICSLLAFSAISAMAADGGHGGHVVPTPDTSEFKVITISSGDVTVPGTVTSVTPLSLDAVTAALKTGTVTGYPIGVTPMLLTGFALDISHDAGVSGDIKLGTDVLNQLLDEPTGAFIQKKDPSTEMVYYTMTGGAIKNVDLDLHFSAANVILVKDAAVTPSSSGSSGGCNAAAAPVMLLLAALPLLYMRKR